MKIIIIIIIIIIIVKIIIMSRYALDTHTVLKFSDLFIFTVRIQNTFSRGVRYKHNVAGHQ